MTRRRQIILFSAEILLIGLWVWQGWPWWALLALLTAPPVVLTFADFAQIMLEMVSWIMPFTDLIEMIREGDGNDIREDLLDSYAKGERNPTSLIVLAATYEYAGDGVTAQRYADEAYELEDGDHLCRQRSVGARLKADALILARFDALVVQGRFTEAAQLIQARSAHSMQTNFMTALAAWAYYLAEDQDTARALLGQIKPLPRWFRLSRSISARYVLLLAHLRHALDGADTRTEIAAHLPEIEEWEATAQRHAHNPYGQRLSTVLNAIRQQIG